MRNSLRPRRRHALYVSAVALLMTACLLLVFSISLELENKFEWTADFSRSAVFTLSEETQAVLNDLQEPVLLYAVYERQSNDMIIQQLLKAYARASDRVSFRLLDPVDDLEELIAFSKAGTAIPSGSVIVSNGDKTSFSVLDSYDFYLVNSRSGGIVGIQAEQSITSAIYHMGREAENRIILMTSHGAPAANMASPFMTHLLACGYTIFQYGEAVNTPFLQTVDLQHDVLLFLSPQSDLAAEEARLLRIFLQNGGRALFFMDYCTQSGAGISVMEEPFPQFNTVFQAAGLQLEYDMILSDTDAAPAVRQTCTAASTELLPNVQPFQDVIMSLSSSISVLGDTAQPVLYSSAEAYVKELSDDLQTLKRASDDAGGRQVMAAFGRLGDGAIFLSGSSSLLTAHNTIASDRRLSLQSIHALVGESGNPVILPVSSANGTLKLQTATEQYALMILLIGVFPAGVVTAGALVLRHRRKGGNGRGRK